MPEETANEGSTSGPWDRLLGDGGAPPTVVAPSVEAPDTDKQGRTDTGFLRSFQRSFKLSVGGKDPQHVFSRYRRCLQYFIQVHILLRSDRYYTPMKFTLTAYKYYNCFTIIIEI